MIVKAKELRALFGENRLLELFMEIENVALAEFQSFNQIVFNRENKETGFQVFNFYAAECKEIDGGYEIIQFLEEGE